MNALYPKGREKFLRGEIDWDDDDIKVALLDDTYTFDEAHEFYDDLTGVVADSGNLTGKTSTNGIADADNVTVPGVPSGDPIVSFVVFQDTGSTATSPLIGYYDRTAASVEIEVTPDGTAVIVNWSNGPTKMFRL